MLEGLNKKSILVKTACGSSASHKAIIGLSPIPSIGPSSQQKQGSRTESAMRAGTTFPPLPPLPPLPPMLEQAGQNHHSPAPNVDKIDFNACKNSDKEIWKAGLGIDNRELEVVFGELKPDQLLGTMFNAFPDPGRSIIIPAHRKRGDRTESGVTELKSGGPGPFSGALNSHRNQLPGIKNSRFKEYLKKYFPKEDVVMQPLENMIKCKSRSCGSYFLSVSVVVQAASIFHWG